jgi:hypothetical protein
MAIRDLFARIGLCESTREREGRPMLVAQLIYLARPYSKKQAEANGEHLSTYEERLQRMLIEAKYWQLDHMIGQNIMPILDSRIQDQKIGFWSSEIYAGLYQQNGQRILSLYDRGDFSSPFFGRGNLDYLSTVFEKTGYFDLNKDHKDPVYVGKLYKLGKVMTFKWEYQENMDYEIKRNPWIMQPPQDFKAMPPKPQNSAPKPNGK